MSTSCVKRLELSPVKKLEVVCFQRRTLQTFMACHHLLTLDRAEARGEIKSPCFHDPDIELLRELGTRHERAYLHS